MNSGKNDARPVRVIGLGNWLLGDEGAGVHAVRQLEAEGNLPAGVECVDGGTGGLSLLAILQESARLVLIDATMDGKPAGTITRLRPQFARDYPPSLAAHDIGLKELLDSLYLLGKTPPVILFAVSIASCPELSTELTPAIAGALPALLVMVRAELD